MSAALVLAASPSATGSATSRGVDARSVITAPANAPNLCLRKSQVHTGEVPWAQRRLEPRRPWALSRGQGVLVAVIGSGIDADNGQFAPGQVLPGKDLLDGQGPADDDCDGSGTFVAGLIAARPDPTTTVTGLAPDAQLLPVRVAQAQERETQPADAQTMADGIDFAVRSGATVVVIYDGVDNANPKLGKAIERATASDVLVVAGGVPQAGQSDTAPATLCGYADVLGVAGISVKGEAIAGSCSGPDVDVSAPGEALISTAAGTDGALGHVPPDAPAPGYAAGYVAAAAALVRSYDPAMTAPAVAARITRTADRPSSGTRDDALGWGVVNPYAAVASVPATDRVDRSLREPTARFTAMPPDRAGTSMVPLVSAGGLVLLAGLSLIAAVAVRSARSRGWRPGQRR
jgi:membrane-anchored mycosin MYCP